MSLYHQIKRKIDKSTEFTDLEKQYILQNLAQIYTKSFEEEYYSPGSG